MSFGSQKCLNCSARFPADKVRWLLPKLKPGFSTDYLDRPRLVLAYRSRDASFLRCPECLMEQGVSERRRLVIEVAYWCGVIVLSAAIIWGIMSAMPPEPAASSLADEIGRHFNNQRGGNGLLWRLTLCVMLVFLCMYVLRRCLPILVRFTPHTPDTHPAMRGIPK